MSSLKVILQKSLPSTANRRNKYSQNEGNALQRYVRNYCDRNNIVGTNGRNVETLIQDILKKHEHHVLKESRVFWRGQTIHKMKAGSWFSCSTSKTAAKKFMKTDGSCCLFKIHVQPGIRVFDVHRALDACRKSVETKRNEKEWIVEGNGVFYADLERKTLGFEVIESGDETIYETYYFPAQTHSLNKTRSKSRSPAKNAKTRKNVSSNRLFSRVPKDEYFLYEDADFTDAKESLKSLLQTGETASNAIFEETYNKIQDAILHPSRQSTASSAASSSP